MSTTAIPAQGGFGFGKLVFLALLAVFVASLPGLMAMMEAEQVTPKVRTAPTPAGLWNVEGYYRASGWQVIRTGLSHTAAQAVVAEIRADAGWWVSQGRMPPCIDARAVPAGVGP